MENNLVIVESPAKAQTIKKFLGEDYVVKSSYGHIRDLAKKNLGIDIENGFEPEYVVSDDKTKVVSELKTAAKKAKVIWLASDEDREGEAIAWHLFEVLGLKKENTKRIVFHEITKNAIVHAIENPRDIDINLVMAQQARRVLDRLVGFELSPLLWKKVAPKLSAGRVQSVAVKLIVEREREILNFKSKPFFKVTGLFHTDGTESSNKIKSTLDRHFETKDQARAFLEGCIGKEMFILDMQTKEGKKSPAAPFTTSSLQQEASRKLGFSVSQTMSIAQRLYESGYITYMRTDSTNLSSLAIGTAEKYIKENYGDQYSKVRQYKTKTKGAQEAHEAIRPTYIEHTSIKGTSQEMRLYELIWKRTIASQMADAKVLKTNIEIGSREMEERFITEAEQILFDGFLTVYMESHDDEDLNAEGEDQMLPKVEIGRKMDVLSIEALQRFSQKPARYTEASLVKKMEELGIGRPSTYAPTISTITQRGYIIKDSREGTKVAFDKLTLKGAAISESTVSETVGVEKSKLFPQDIGMLVTDYLDDNFDFILDYSFTAKVEKDFDKVAEGKEEWRSMIDHFYSQFHKRIDTATEETAHADSKRVLGNDPKTGKVLTAKLGKYGPMVQMGENEDEDKRFAKMRKDQLIETITLEDALQLFEMPRHIGEYKDMELTVSIGRFGPYVKYGSKFTSLKKTQDPYTITYEEACALVDEAITKEANKYIKEFKEEGIEILNGRFGPYIKFESENYKIPKDTDAASLTLEECKKIISETVKKPKTAKRSYKKK